MDSLPGKNSKVWVKSLGVWRTGTVRSVENKHDTMVVRVQGVGRRYDTFIHCRNVWPRSLSEDERDEAERLANESR